MADDPWREIIEMLKIRLEDIGNTLEAKITNKIKNYEPYPITNTGQFQQSIFTNVREDKDGLILEIGSSVPYAKYILGGKAPSWTPLAPLEAWVDRKKLNWTDKSGNKLSTKQMAWMIRRKIKREGIKEKNVFQDVVKNEINWIEQQLNQFFG